MVRPQPGGAVSTPSFHVKPAPIEGDQRDLPATMVNSKAGAISSNHGLAVLDGELAASLGGLRARLDYVSRLAMHPVSRETGADIA